MVIGKTNTGGAQALPSPIRFKIPMLPTSMNKLYGVNYRLHSIYLTNEARYWKSKAKLFIPSFSINQHSKVYINIDVMSDWYFKNGNIKKQDVQNFVKVVVDAISEKCGFDDSRVWSFSANKYQSTEQCVWVSMGVLSEENGKAPESVEKGQSPTAKKH